MSGFAGFYQKNSLLSNSRYHYSLLEKMIHTQKHRQSAKSKMENLLLTDTFALASTDKIYSRKMYGRTYQFLLCGEIYNTEALKKEIQLADNTLDCDTMEEVILCGFLCFGESFFRKLKGCFSFILVEEESKSLYLVRDSFGCRPLFYTRTETTLLFATELKALLAHPDCKAVLDKKGLNEVFSLGPARTPGCGVFANFCEVEPGHFLRVTPLGEESVAYWSLEAAPHTDSYEETVEKTSDLVRKAILSQCSPAEDVGTLLSGGLDSSVVTAVCAGVLKEKNLPLRTYSFDYKENDKHFTSNDFQPSQDRPYVDAMVSYLGTEHTYLECSQEALFETLEASLTSHDLPPMGDIDASLLYFSRIVAKDCPIVLTGECADEVFGGYPWFHKKEMLARTTFPWTPSAEPRKVFLKEDFVETLGMDDYIAAAYENTLKKISYLPSDTEEDRAKRRNGYLSLSWFGATLLNRMERCGASAGLCARVPFADRDLAEYVYNAPWDMKLRDGVVKNLLREAFRKDLPEEVLFRRKSPYPKTYHPAYENLLKARLTEIITDSASPLHMFVEKEKILSFIAGEKDYGAPWYGQLMAGPQMMAYLIQMDYWMRKYRIEVVI